LPAGPFGFERGGGAFDPSRLFHLIAPSASGIFLTGSGCGKVRVMREFDRWLDERPSRLRLVLTFHSAVLLGLIAVIFAFAA
jgi:hypothetical protein